MKLLFGFRVSGFGLWACGFTVLGCRALGSRVLRV